MSKSVDADLPRLRLEQRDFLALPEYSATFPTGVIVGKMWRRLVHAYGERRWIVGAYVRPSDWAPGDKRPESMSVCVKWYKPIVVVRCA